MSDAIKAALDAAWEASLKCAHVDDIPATAIAAFLRALPDDAEMVVPVAFDSGELHDVAFYEDWQTLAAAVEEAARDE